jgi:hypothetical protein
MAFGQLESAWPVPGSVLVHNETAYVCAGRTSTVDGGFELYALNIRTGKQVWQKKPTIGERRPFIFRSVNDIMLSDGTYAYLKGWRFDLKTGENGPNLGRKNEAEYMRIGRPSMLDNAWCRFRSLYHNRQSDWKYGGYYGIRGLLLTQNKETLFGIYTNFRSGKEATQLFCIVPKFEKVERYMKNKAKPVWTADMPFPAQIEALVHAGSTLFAAGPINREDRTKKGFVCSYSAADGKKLGTADLPFSPVYDGMAAAYSRLYVSTMDGTVLCFGKK